ncbi:phosphoribosyltransferase-like protein [Larsenimonas rhizosphaerae]|uniref:PRTase-CE domain-containing protein n=1 Tax=Larsenimonas rhizosphaerae TaxID=2944682 RepID=A0AA42CY61_9GAMM|nr:hypothetical protein [Larsenimonas rhizosphaerae]MCX2524735.1 hypothetical protein [Larsenimonas rhizosphaerae]
MDERENLLVSVANEIKTYREEDLVEPTPEHVECWLNQFTPANQLPFLREFNHVIKQTFFTKENVQEFLRNLVGNKNLAGGNPREYWASANFLKIQQKGQSQKEMLKLFAKCLEDECGLNMDTCGTQGGDFIYLDDVIFSGGRVGQDLNAWIIHNAPQSAKIHVIVAAIHSSGGWFLSNKRLKKAIVKSGKKSISLIGVLYRLKIGNGKKILQKYFGR